jgi:hypothetical protein
MKSEKPVVRIERDAILPTALAFLSYQSFIESFRLCIIFVVV